MAIITDQKRIDDLLTRGIEHIYPNTEFTRKALASGKRLRIYAGFDPTGPALHIGHGIQVRKLAQLQALGHEIIFLIGDFTAMIGDPTDKGAARTQLTKKEVLANCKGYKKQVERLISFSGKNAAEIMYNSKWLAKMKFADVLDLASHYTVQQMLERDMFEKRVAEGKPVFIHEFMYPLMQGYDSVMMDVDGEVGGNDQTFNMLAGRTLLKELKDKEKFVLTCKLLTDAAGKKMGKTEGNMISLTDSAQDMFGKVMSWTDSMIMSGFEILTDIPMDEVRDMERRMAAGENPRDFKLRLAHEVVAIYKGAKEADAAKENFIALFSKKEVPQDMPVKQVGSRSLLDVLVESGLVVSKGEARRAVEQGGVCVDEIKITEITHELAPGEHVIQKGKRHFVKVKVK